MTREEFLGRLRKALSGIPSSELNDIMADYRAHFEEASVNGRTEAETAEALGDPRRLGREHLSDVFYREWQLRAQPLGLAKWFMVSRGLAFLLPVIGLVIALALMLVVALVLVLAGLLFGSGTLLFTLAPFVTGAILFAIIAVFIAKLAFLKRDPMNASGYYYGTDSGETVKRELDWAPGDAMSIHVPADVHWKPAPEARAVIRGNPWVLEHIRLESGQLHGRFKWRFFQNNHIRLELEGPAIEKWAVIGSGALFLHDVSQPSLRLEVTGSGDIQAAGKVEDAYVAITGSGDVDISMLSQRNTTVEMEGTGDATIAPSEEATLTMTGNGDIKLLSNPLRIKTRKTGNGDIRMADGSQVQ